MNWYYNVRDKPGTPVRQKELVDQGVQGTLHIPTEPIVLHNVVQHTAQHTGDVVSPCIRELSVGEYPSE